MPLRPERTLVSCLILAIVVIAAAPASAECPAQDLTVVLNTGWDESTGGAVIPAGNPDDDWDVIVDASGGSVPRDADVVIPNAAWLSLPQSAWIAADQTGPNGTYIYETCWCMDDDFANPNLTFAIRADDQADVFLNGTPLLSLPDGTFNDATAPGMTVVDPTLFVIGENCLQVEVENKYGVVTGFNLTGEMTADDGLCCGCDPGNLSDDGSTGVDDVSGSLIVSGLDDDEWVVTTSASGGVLPRPAEVIDTFAGWNVIPGTKWISADENGPNGLYTYEKCWCMNDFFQNAQLSMEILADDRADVFLNGNPIGSTPASGAFLFPATTITTSDQSLFQGGENCVTVEVTNVSSVVTGLDVAMQVTAANGECCPCAELPTDAEAWWPLDEATGPTAFELLNNHDGTWMQDAGTPPPPSSAPGYVNDSILLDGVDDFIEVPDDPGLDFGAGEDLSIDAWIKTDTVIRQAIVHKRRQLPFEAAGYMFATSGPALFMMADGANLTACVGSTNLADDQWHFVAVTVDRDLPGGIRLYVDGAIDAVCDPTTVPGSLANNDLFYIGADPFAPGGAFLWWDGQLDEIEVFRRALTETEILDIYLAGYTGKCPPGDCVDSSGNPVCEGSCPDGLVCLNGGPAAAPCDCFPETSTCGSNDPVCNGLCPDPDDVCVDSDMDGHCTCEPVALCEGMDEWPECDAACPPGFVCENNGQRCHCVTSNPCELSPYPICNGLCPDSSIPCVPGPAGDCFCDTTPALCEGFATFPECNGICPDDPNLVCVNNGQRCHCELPEVCGNPDDFPVCAGPCPEGFECLDINGIDCECYEIETPCSDTTYPECDGDCPPGESCKNIPGTNVCECLPDAVVCGDPLYPVCDGICPSNQECKQSPNQGCWCITCGTGVPFDPAKPIQVYLDKDKKIRWTEVTCALVYNLYRGEGRSLRDLDDDGLADDYGSCYIEDIIGSEVVDPDDPQPDRMYWYLVTAENFAGEGPLGDASNGLPRQATQGCP